MFLLVILLLSLFSLVCYFIPRSSVFLLLDFFTFPLFLSSFFPLISFPLFILLVSLFFSLSGFYYLFPFILSCLFFPVLLSFGSSSYYSFLHSFFSFSLSPLLVTFSFPYFFLPHLSLLALLHIPLVLFLISFSFFFSLLCKQEVH